MILWAACGVALSAAVGSLLWVATDDSPGRRARGLVARLRKHDGDCQAIADELAKIGEPAVPALIDALSEEDVIVRTFSKMALQEIGRRALPQLADALADEKKPGRARRLMDLIGITADEEDAPTVRPPLVQWTKHEDDQARLSAAVALLRVDVGDELGWRTLLSAVKSPRPELRLLAVKGLSWLSYRDRAVEAIRSAANDPDERVQVAAQEALESGRGPDPPQHDFPINMAVVVRAPVPQDPEALFRIFKQDKWGYMDNTGRIVIKPVFDTVAEQFREGRAWVQLDHGHGFIDPTGRIVIQPHYRDGWHFTEGLARVRRGDRYGYITVDGKTAIKFQFRWAGPFSGGRAPVKVKGVLDRYGYIDRSGNLVIQPRSDYPYAFRDGLAPIEIDGRFGYMNRNGEVVIGPRFDVASEFHEGRAAVRMGEKVGCIDTAGRLIMPPRFDGLHRFREGLAAACVGDKCGFVDREGHMVIDERFEEGEDFHDGLCAVRAGGKWGYIDPKGQWVLPPQFDWATHFRRSIAWVQVSSHRGYIDRTGKWLWRASGPAGSD